jgi:uncharacterized protein
MSTAIQAFSIGASSEDGAAPVGAAPGATPGAAWSGDRTFVVRRRTIEDRAGSVCSFYLVPEDGEPLPVYRPGQYLAFALEVPDPAGGPHRQPVRCWLSDRPRPDCYRISVKRVLAPGLASNHIFDRIRENMRLAVRAPAGRFHLIEDGDLPIVLIAQDMGIAPLLAMLNTLAHWSDPREVWLYYGVRNGAEHVMKRHLEALRAGHPQLHLHVCYAEPGPDDEPGRDYRHAGRPDMALLRRTLPFGRYEFYLCGPSAMMESLVPALEDEGVAPENVHYPEQYGEAPLPA